jgi:hypothetical protein
MSYPIFPNENATLKVARDFESKVLSTQRGRLLHAASIVTPVVVRGVITGVPFLPLFVFAPGRQFTSGHLRKHGPGA